MYNTKYECRYYKDEVFLDTDKVSEDEKDYIRDVLYKEDLLHIFCIEDDDDFDIFDSAILELYEKLLDCQELKEIMRMTAGKLMSDNEQVGLCLLYSYDFMHLMHNCVSKYLENASIPVEELSRLKSKL